MDDKKTNPVFDKIRAKLPDHLLAPFAFAAGIPLAVQRVFESDAAPDGLRILHVATSIPEAEMLRQVLSEAGFEIEYVPATSTGVFGTTGNNVIYISEEKYPEAAQFLADYLNPQPPELPQALE